MSTHAHTPKPAAPSTAAPTTASPSRGTLSPALRLQRAAGNFAVGQLLQAKLVLGSPHDPAEREADEMADRAVSATPGAQCSCGSPGAGDCEACREKRERLSRSPSGTSAPTGLAPPIVHDVLAGSGQPLGQSTRSHMESRFGHDFGHVRIHDHPQAAESARAIGANAYAVGRDVVFASGQYAPGTSAGRRLLAHELAHVIQQGAVLRRDPAGQTSPKVPASLVAPEPVQPKEPNQTLAGPPVIWGLDMAPTQTTLYLSVSIPGHSLAQVATYLYGSPDAAAALKQTNPGLIDQLPPGRTFRPAPGKLTDAAAVSLKHGLDSGFILRTKGMPQPSGGETRGIIMILGGETITLTEGQFEGMLQGVATTLRRKANYLIGIADVGKSTRKSHLEGTNSAIRATADFFAGQDVPSEFDWTIPQKVAKDLITDLQVSPLTLGTIGRAGTRLKKVEDDVNNAERNWNRYINRTIQGGERAIEVTKDVAFSVVAMAAGAFVAPVILAAAAAAGVGGAGATALAVGGSALAGGTARSGLEMGYTLGTSMPGQKNDYVQIGLTGFYKGAVEGAIGGAGALATPGISSGISGKLFGGAKPATLGLGGRVAVGSLTGVAIGTPSGAVGAALENLPVLLGGKMSGSQYARSILIGSLFGAAAGGILGGLSGIRAPKLGPVPPPTSRAIVGPIANDAICLPPADAAPVLDFTVGTGGGTPPPSEWNFSVLSADQATGNFSILGQNTRTGSTMILKMNAETGNGFITDMLTGDVTTIQGGRLQPRPIGLLGPGPQGAAPVPDVTPTPATTIPQLTTTPIKGYLPWPYPPETPQSDAAAKLLLRAIGKTGLPSSSAGRAIGVYTHQDGTVTAAVSGENTQALTDALDKLPPGDHLPTGWTLGPATITPLDVSPQGLRSWRTPSGKIVEGRATCVEPRLSAQGRLNPSPVTGMTVMQWGGKKPIPGLTDPTTGKMCPCNSCKANSDFCMIPINVAPTE